MQIEISKAKMTARQMKDFTFFLSRLIFSIYFKLNFIKTQDNEALNPNFICDSMSRIIVYYATEFLLVPNRKPALSFPKGVSRESITDTEPLAGCTRLAATEQI